MVNLMARLGGRGRHNGANAIVHLAREVVGRRRTIQNATQEARNAAILDSLADEDFRALDTTIAERATSDREFAQTLARLTYAAARAKGFDRCVVDAALRLDSLIPTDDPVHERDRLLREAYHSAQKASYIRGGRLALGRLGRRAVEAGDLERARVLLHQQLDLGPEKDDTAAEVDSALVLGDILRREGDDDHAQTFYRRAAAAAERLEYRQGVAEALVRQIDTTPAANLETVVALQHQALDAAQRTGDQALEARILVGLADALVASERLEDATPYFENALELARETGDLALEARCVTALADAHRRLGHTLDAIASERTALEIEERLGNRPAAANWALRLGQSELRLRNAAAAIDAFDRARLLGNQVEDAAIQQRAEGNLGIAHALLGHGPETIDHLGRAIGLARQSRDQAQEAQWVSSLGQAYWLFGQIDDAIRVTNDAIALAEATRNVELQAESFTLLGQIHAAQRETIRARDCFTRALQLNRDLGQTAEQVATLTALGTLAADTGQFTQASQLFDQALSLALSTDDRSTATMLHGRMGSLAQKRGDLRSALGHYQRSVELAQSLGDAALLSRTLQHLATAQDVMGEAVAVGSYERAVTAADEAGDIRGGITMRLNMGMLLGRLPEQGAAEDAIGWLSDAANYALDAGADYTDLRKQAEQQIMALGGSTGRSAALDDRRTDAPAYPGDATGWREDERDESGFDPAPRQYDAYEAFDDDEPDDEAGDDRRGYASTGPLTADDRYDDRYGDGYDDQYGDGPVDGEPDEIDAWRGNGQRLAMAPTDRYDDDGYDDDGYDGYGDERSAQARRPYADDVPPGYAPRRADPRDAYDAYEPVYGDRYAERDRDRDEDGPYDPYAPESTRGGYEDQRFDADVDGYEPVASRRWDEAPYRGGSGSPRSRWDDEPSYLDARSSGRYADVTTQNDADDDRDHGTAGSDRWPHEGPSGRGSDDDRGVYWGVTEPRGNGEARGYVADRYGEYPDDEPARSYSGQPDNDRDYYPRQPAGRAERTGRRDGGARARNVRGIDDEPSEPDRSRQRRRQGLGGYFSRQPHETRAGRRPREQRGTSRRTDGLAPPLQYDEPYDRGAYHS